MPADARTSGCVPALTRHLASQDCPLPTDMEASNMLLPRWMRPRG